MKNNYFNENNNLFEITEKYPETIDVFVTNGFENMKDLNSRKLIGKMVTLKQALNSKKININTFSNLLIEAIENKENNVDLNERRKVKSNTKIKLQGLLPCPVRLPLLEGLNTFLDENIDIKAKLDYELKAASQGLDWLKDDVINELDESKISDIFISAGFDLFFEKNLIGKFKDKKVFKDMSGYNKFNNEFSNKEISLMDPDRDYSIIGVVPAVFLVNKAELGDREMPKSWADILKPEYKNKISLPIGDFDLFNAILLNIYKVYGEDGVRKLGENLLKDLHPSEMVKSHTKQLPPTVTIMPYFFTKMVTETSPMAFVWPNDGAIISPIFMLTKAAKEKELTPIAKFFASKKVGEILSHKGYFPSTNPEVLNKTPKDSKYMWIGWDYIKNNDIGKLITKCEKIFQEGVRG